MTRFRAFVIRDLLIAAICAALWIGDVALAPRGGLVSMSVGVLAGIATVLVAFLGHEWGHLTGALASGATVRAPHFPSWFLFHFDVARSSRRQFLAMSYGGYLASAIGMVIIAAAVPWDRPSGWTALTLVVAGLIVTAVLEIPTHVRVHRGGPLPTGAVYVSK